MESLNSNMKAVLITPLVSSLELGWRKERKSNERNRDWIEILHSFTCKSCVFNSDVYLEIQQCIQLVLNDGQSLNQLLRVHGAHYTFGPGNRQEYMHTNTHATNIELIRPVD